MFQTLAGTETSSKKIYVVGKFPGSRVSLPRRLHLSNLCIFIGQRLDLAQFRSKTARGSADPEPEGANISLRSRAMAHGTSRVKSVTLSIPQKRNAGLVLVVVANARILSEAAETLLAVPSDVLKASQESPPHMLFVARTFAQCQTRSFVTRRLSSSGN